MLKELFNLFRSEDALARMGDDFSEMLALSYGLTLDAGRILFQEASEGHHRAELSKRDVQINKVQREIRKQVITHLTLNKDRGDVPYCLLLMSIVKDVERLGDYAKNLAEIREEGGAPIPDDANGLELRGIRSAAEATFGAVSEVFATSDSKRAVGLIQEGRKINRRCDELVARVAKSTYDAYEVRDRADKRAIREFLKREGQFLLPMLELVEQTEVAIAEVIQVMGRATIEAVLEMSAEGVAGPKQAGRSRAEDDTAWYGRQGGVVYLSDRKVRVERPRLRRRGAEVDHNIDGARHTLLQADRVAPA